MEAFFHVDIANKINEIRREHFREEYVSPMEEKIKCIIKGKEHFLANIDLNELDMDDDLYDDYMFAYTYINFPWTG